jgi:hypothetical protein
MANWWNPPLEPLARHNRKGRTMKRSTFQTLAITLFLAGAGISNIPLVKTLEMRQLTPANQAYHVETSADLANWARNPVIRFGTGEVEAFEVPVTDGINGFVRLANVGQPPVGTAPWALGAGTWQTASQSAGAAGVLEIMTGSNCRLGMETTAAAPTEGFTYLRTGMDTATLKTATKAVKLTWGTGTLGFYCQESLAASGVSEETRCGTFTAATRQAIPTQINGVAFAFSQNGENQLFSTSAGGDWTLRKSGATLTPMNVTFTQNGSSASLSIEFSSSLRDVYQLNFTSPNGGSFSRQEIRGASGVERLSGSFSVN